jgi:uncharacterized protein YqeY
MTVKEKIIEYRNAHKETRVLLGVVLGEFERAEKAPKRVLPNVTDEEAVTIIKKLIQSNIECNVVGENEILELFIPKQLTAFDIEAVLIFHKFPEVKHCMNYFKAKYSGLYNGKEVSQLYKKVNG